MEINQKDELILKNLEQKNIVATIVIENGNMKEHTFDIIYQYLDELNRDIIDEMIENGFINIYQDSFFGKIVRFNFFPRLNQVEEDIYENMERQIGKLSNQDYLLGKLSFDELIEEMRKISSKYGEYYSKKFDYTVYTPENIGKFNEVFKTEFVFLPQENEFWENKQSYQKHLKYINLKQR